METDDTTPSPETDTELDWSPPIETLARVRDDTPSSFRTLLPYAIGLGIALVALLWMLRPGPAGAQAAPVKRTAPALSNVKTEKVELFELPAWDDAAASHGRGK